MGIYFGTDGVRGVVNNDLTEQLAQMVGNALSRKKRQATILIGRDTRVSGSYLSSAFAVGVMKGGGKVVDVGIIPTAGISYLVKAKKADFGVMISASHNSKQYNGIKIFDENGRKLSEKEEYELERFFTCPLVAPSTKVGKYKQATNFVNFYAKFLQNSVKDKFNGLKIVLDCANGAAYKVAPKVYKNLGAEVVKIFSQNSGLKINEKCGSTNIESLRERVLSEKADVGFAYDGDADRVIAVDEKGNVIDGDGLIYILAKQMSKQNLLNANTVVGTSHTNSGLLVGLNSKKINLVRTDIGDKYVIEAMEKMNLSLGGEQSGHIIIKRFLSTGDGILASLQIVECMIDSGMPLSKLFDCKFLKQLNKDIYVEDKMKVVNNEKVTQKISQILSEISPSGRVLVRASGTEPKIRIMVEYQNEKIAQKYLSELEEVILSVL